MKKIQIYTQTSSTKCDWCGIYGQTKQLKISPKKYKLACLSCHDMMTWKYEIKDFQTEEKYDYRFYIISNIVLGGITHRSKV